VRSVGISVVDVVAVVGVVVGVGSVDPVVAGDVVGDAASRTDGLDPSSPMQAVSISAAEAVTRTARGSRRVMRVRRRERACWFPKMF
jgi:hypothetical protein